MNSSEVTKYRPPKEELNPLRPYFFLNEEEVQADGELKSVNTVFLTNKECSFKCVMCDLWRHTLDEPTPPGAIPRQIEYALERLPAAGVIKLYNNGNFFDAKAIPRSDHPAIAALLSEYDHVIVENHPKLTGPVITEFRDRLNGSFEIAMGLETIHPDVFPRLNKQMTPGSFREATGYLTGQNISVRAFILLNPPFLTDARENMEWCLRSVEFAFDASVSACSIIPVRGGNGIMEKLWEEGRHIHPTLAALEEVFERALAMQRGRVFCDLWDLEKFSDCDACFYERKARIHTMNMEQKSLPRVECGRCKAGCQVPGVR